MNLSTYSDSSRSIPLNECECGNEKSIYSEACRRCTYLDGNRGASRIIEALRTAGNLSIVEICGVLDIPYDWQGKGGARSILRNVQSLLKAGRIRRYWRDVETMVAPGPAFGQSSKRHGVGGHGCWVYALTERGAQ